MNNSRRLRLSKAESRLAEAQQIVSEILDEEQDSFDNIPENLQGSEHCQRIEDALDKLSDTAGYIDEAMDCIKEICE